MSNLLGINYSSDSSDDEGHKHHKEAAVESMDEGENGESEVDENDAESTSQNEKSPSENSHSEEDHKDNDNTEKKPENGWAKLQAEAANDSMDVDPEQEQGAAVPEKKEAEVIDVDEATKVKNEPPPAQTAVSSRSEKKQYRFNVEMAVKFSRKLQKMDPKDFRMPDPPAGECSAELMSKLEGLMNMRKEKNLSEMIQSRKDFRNPSIYDKLIQVCKINERGTNFPKEDFDPEFWYKQPTYEDLARAQREEYAKQKKTKVEHVTGTAKKSGSRPGSSEPAKKSKWDKASSDTLLKQAQQAPANIKYPFSVATSSTTSSSSRTSIPAVGHLTKDKLGQSRASSHSK